MITWTRGVRGLLSSTEYRQHAKGNKHRVCTRNGQSMSTGVRVCVCVKFTLCDLRQRDQRLCAMCVVCVWVSVCVCMCVFVCVCVRECV